jgi:hypothetical protein
MFLGRLHAFHPFNGSVAREVFYNECFAEALSTRKAASTAVDGCAVTNRLVVSAAMDVRH